MANKKIAQPGSQSSRSPFSPVCGRLRFRFLIKSFSHNERSRMNKRQKPALASFRYRQMFYQNRVMLSPTIEVCHGRGWWNGTHVEKESGKGVHWWTRSCCWWNWWWKLQGRRRGVGKKVTGWKDVGDTGRDGGGSQRGAERKGSCQLGEGEIVLKLLWKRRGDTVH